jgi:hypothetical protein
MSQPDYEWPTYYRVCAGSTVHGRDSVRNVRGKKKQAVPRSARCGVRGLNQNERQTHRAVSRTNPVI